MVAKPGILSSAGIRYHGNNNNIHVWNTERKCYIKIKILIEIL